MYEAHQLLTLHLTSHRQIKNSVTAMIEITTVTKEKGKQHNINDLFSGSGYLDMVRQPYISYFKPISLSHTLQLANSLSQFTKSTIRDIGNDKKI